MRLFEITTTIPWEWTNLSDEQANASFTVGNIKYEFIAKNSEDEHLEQINANTTFTGQGGGFS